ncbi:MAG TPA: VWA domain-containing protein, partial [Phycisphaerales bacterium]|nr:VWA domain-containing protein [Phycisphaerales bacterium]
MDDEVIVEGLDAPPRAPGRSVVTLRVLIRSTGHSTGVLRLEREGKPVDLGGPGGGRRLTLEPGRRVERIEVPLDGGRLSRFRAVYEPDTEPNGTLSGDRSIENNRAEAFTISPGENRVLVVDGVSDGRADGGGMVLPRALMRAGLDVKVVAPSGMPRDILGLQAFDTVILQNVSAEEMPGRTQENLSAFVRELGGGLIVVGGPDTLGAGGWRGSALEEILPVKLDLPERLVVPEAAIVFVLDASGSMAAPVMGSSRSQQNVANEAAARAIESIDRQDMVGVIAFSNEPWVVVPLTKASDRASIASATRGISSGGGTNIAPALEVAREQLSGVEVKTRHIILLSDGQSQRADVLPSLADEIRADGIRITTIAVGDGADLETMREIADRGDGAFYHVLNPTVLPAVFLKAVRVLRSPLVREKPFDVVMRDTGSPLTEGLGEPPRLGGLVLTQELDDPSVTTAMSAPTGEPVLAHRPVELGHVAVFTSDASKWAKHWLDWPGYGLFWSRAARLL